MKNTILGTSSFMKITAVVVFAASMVVNGLAGTTILGGNTTAQVSDAYPNLFAPAGVTFAIWGIIYLLLAIFCVRLFIKPKHQTAETGELMHELTKNFITVTVLNTAWLFAWQYQVMWLSVILIVGMLVVLARISTLTFNRRLPNSDWLSLKLPFSVYFGWITVATIANITAFLVSIGWNGWGVSSEVWTAIVLLVGVAVGVMTALRRQNWPYLAVFVWAYFGIWLKHTSVNGHDNAHPTLISLLVMTILALSLLTLWLAYRWPKGTKQILS